MEDLGTLLVRSGLRTAIIVAETAMTRKQITAARKKFGIRGAAESGPLPQAESLLANRPMTLEASLFMHAYLLIANQPKAGVDIKAVLAAHAHYLDCHGAIRGGRVDVDTMLELDRAWVLARDYRSMSLGMRSCHNCHIEFVASFNDRRQACPICSGTNIKSSTHANDAPPMRSIEEFIEISEKVKNQINWGNSDDEIIADLALRDDELDLCKELARMSPRQLGSLVESNSNTAEIFGIIRGAPSAAVV